MTTQLTFTTRKVYRLSDAAIVSMLEIIQDALINEKPAGEKLLSLRYVPSLEDERDLVESIAGLALSAGVFSQLGNLVQLAVSSHTPFIDHCRIILLEEKDGAFVLTPEYVEHYNATIEAMVERAQEAFQPTAATTEAE